MAAAGAAKATPIFHITHVENLPGMASAGLLCDAAVAAKGVAHRSIAYSNIKQMRAQTPVPVGPQGTLCDYVPFYFAPRSPMLFTISQNNVPGAHGTQPDIVHLVTSAEAVAAAGIPFVFTNGHAIMALSDFFDDLGDLPKLDWAAVGTRQWGSYYDSTDETKRKKQSEFLVHQAVPWSLIRGIGVKSAACQQKVASALSGVAHQPAVLVRPDWYY